MESVSIEADTDPFKNMKSLFQKQYDSFPFTGKVSICQECLLSS